MFSGKTEELIRRVKRAHLARQRVLLFKPRVDDRYDAVKVVTHEGVNADATAVGLGRRSMVGLRRACRSERRSSASTRCSSSTTASSRVAERLADRRHSRVIVAGLDQDFRGQPFGPMAAPHGIAEYVTKLHAVCTQCGAAATPLAAARGRPKVSSSSAARRLRAALPADAFVPGVVDG